MDAAKATKETSDDDVVDLAFRKHTKMDSMHIIHYILDEHYNQDGKLVESQPSPCIVYKI